MGTENANGDFEIVDLKVPDLPRQPQRWERDDAAAVLAKSNTKQEQERREGGKVAIVSGLGISGDEAESLSLDLLMEFLLGEAGGPTEQQEACRISRLIIAGNSLVESAPLPSSDDLSGKKIGKKYGYDSSAYNPAPTVHLDTLLSTLLPSIPITLLPGDSDPANVSLPQQAMHPALFPQSRAYAATPGSEESGWFDSVTNPWEGDVDGWRLMGTGGQPVDDVYKYVDGEERLDMMESMLRWRCGAPTAPDTLCEYLVFLNLDKNSDSTGRLLIVVGTGCYPFQEKDQFVIEECPHVYFVGNQPKFETTVIEGPAGQNVRLIAVPKFKERGEVVLLDMDSLDVEILKFSVYENT